MRIRRPKLIAMWLTIAAVLVIALVSAAHVEAILAYFLLLFFALQGLMSEFRGVEVNADGISFPNLPIMWFPVLTLWRKRISRRKFDRIDRHGAESVVIFVGGDPVVLRLPSHDDQIAFLRYCSKVYPGKQISH